jgi:hypothetical protein
VLAVLVLAVLAVLVLAHTHTRLAVAAQRIQPQLLAPAVLAALVAVVVAVPMATQDLTPAQVALVVVAKFGFTGGNKMNYAIIENGVVANIAASDSPLAPNWIQSDTAAIGDLYDGTTFAKPAPLPPTREELKAQREAAVAAIKVTTQAGNTFDGDEVSQTRMTRAITALMAIGGAVNWVLADNTVIQADAAELTEALALAGAAQAAIWVI